MILERLTGVRGQSSFHSWACPSSILLCLESSCLQQKRLVCDGMSWLIIYSISNPWTDHFPWYSWPFPLCYLIAGSSNPTSVAPRQGVHRYQLLQLLGLHPLHVCSMEVALETHGRAGHSRPLHGHLMGTPPTEG